MIVLLFAVAVAYVHPEQLVDTAWLAAHANDANVRLLDLRRSGYDAAHIPGALWLDPESIRDPKNAPTFLLPAEAFAQAMGQLGITSRTRVILYDDRGGLLASRLWWMLHAYGHSDVALVNGGWVRLDCREATHDDRRAAGAPGRDVHRDTSAAVAGGARTTSWPPSVRQAGRLSMRVRWPRWTAATRA